MGKMRVAGIEGAEPMNRLHRLAILAGLLLSACVVYETSFDRSWAAASGAMYDQGLTITTQDRSAGVIRGDHGGITITATVETRPDGRVQVKFNSSGATGTDPSLIDRV